MADEQKRAARKPRQGSKRGASRAALAEEYRGTGTRDAATGILPLAQGYFALRNSAASVANRRAR